MFAVSYQFLVLLFAFCYSAFFFLILRRKTKPAAPSSRRLEFLYVGAVLVLLVVPWILYAEFSPRGFRNVDILAYMPDSQEILRQGSIPQPAGLLQSQYYASFPAFTLLMSTLSVIAGLTALEVAYAMNVLIQVLFWLAVWVLLTKHFAVELKYRFLLVGVVLAAFANPYLYGYFNTPLPQTMGLCILLLLLIASMQATTSYSTLYIFLITLSLVHVSIIPIFILALSALLFFNAFTKQQTVGSMPKKTVMSLFLPLVVFLTYLFYTIAILPVADYMGRIVSFLSDLTKDALAGQIAVTEGLPRGELYALNALGPALVIGATVSYLIFYIQAVHQKRHVNNWLGVTAAISLLFILLGSLRGQFTVWGTAFFSISRYFNLPGFMLATIVTCFVIAKVLEQEDRKWLVIPLFIALVLSAIGGLIDPLVFSF